jgi:hypothetical protein
LILAFQPNHPVRTPIKEPLAAIIPDYLEAYQSGQETGDFIGAANVAESAVIIKYYLGTPLMKVEQEMIK